MRAYTAVTAVLVLSACAVVGLFAVDSGVSGSQINIAAGDQIQVVREKKWIGLERQHPVTLTLLDYMAGLREYQHEEGKLPVPAVSLAPVVLEVRVLDAKGNQRYFCQLLGDGGLFFIDTAKLFYNSKYSREEYSKMVTACITGKQESAKAVNAPPPSK